MNHHDMNHKLLFGLLAALLGLLPTHAEVDLNYEAGLTLNAGDHTLAPYYITANRYGTVTQQYGTQLNASLFHRMDTTSRFSWGAGVELWGGWTSSTSYLNLADPANPVAHNEHPARVWLQQVFGEVKYRGLMVIAGAKHRGSPLLNDMLSSGDLVHSANARPMPGLTAGFVNFQNVPFTRGWLQIAGEIGYYKPADTKWLEHHYNYANHFLTTGTWFHYKNIYFRTHPMKPVVLTLGMQAACQFGGDYVTYQNGTPTRTIHQESNAKAFWKAFIPGSGSSNTGDKYYEGNHVGSWDIRLDWHINPAHTLRAFHQHLWEDGSGIGFRNGFDGLWGIEYKAWKPAWVSGATIEYIDLTNQSGPIHWAPKDHAGTPLTDEATGADDYYNNYAFNGYQNRGMAIGSPMVKGTIHNRDGYLRFTDNRIRGFHVALCGDLSTVLSYRAMAGYRKSWGTPFEPRVKPASDTSWMLEATYKAPRQFQLKAQIAGDHGTLYGNNFGCLLSISYNGLFTLGKK